MSQIAAVVLVMLATVLIGAFGIRVSRTTSDFYVASRTVSPVWNASAIGGEYLSAASFLGVAGLILTFGADMLWLPVGWTGGYLVLLVLVSAPLRRSGAYTLPDFAEARLESMAVRRLSSVLVVLIGWLYLMPQFQSAGLVFRTITGAPPWTGSLLVAVVVATNVLSGGMRSITFVQAFQYWLKLTALAVPLAFMLVAWWSDGRPGLAPGDEWVLPLHGRDHPVYETYSLILATFLGTMGLPHVLVRFYTNPDGRAARRTTLVVLTLLGAFYLMPAVYGYLGHVYGMPESDTVVIALPGRLVGGSVGEFLTALVTAGAFAAFLSTSSGLTVSVAGVIAQDILRGGVRAFRVATVLACSCRSRWRRGPVAAGGDRGGAGVRRGRVVVLPAARARHLVAQADDGGGDGRAAGRGRAGLRGGRDHDHRRPPHRLGGVAAGRAGGLDGARVVHGHGGGVAADAVAGAARRSAHDGPPAHAGDAERRPGRLAPAFHVAGRSAAAWRFM